ncbi:MAG: Dam family site-specific DNA-(adenine-N6)-methyltransferase [Defluviitaleaceae bacterium]|nr:Dam family site-specific DNA-(adenine-N6)-methyltransferase [Defluviitaleaceae bacterium]
MNENCENVQSLVDIFAGTGAVASAFADKQIITNDLLHSNYITHIAWFSPLPYDATKITQTIECYNAANPQADNYMSLNFADTFFSKDDCKKIGFIREDIENLLTFGKINEREHALLLTSLLYAVDKIANTCGHYDAYRKGVTLENRLELAVPVPFENLHPKNQCFNTDANALAKQIMADLVYIDPPYNSRQYSDAYHLLENLARWEKPAVFGTARKMDRTSLKSDYCTSKATAAFADLIKNINAKYILLSYNNMGEKGNGRSNAKITDADIMRILSEKGEVSIFTQNYKAFSTGKSDIKDNQERLFLCVCRPPTEPAHRTGHPHRKIIQSPLNYTGGKFKLLNQILPHFPKKIETFVDLFCGGCNVGVNVQAENVIFNDNNHKLIFLYKALKNLDLDATFEMIAKIIEKYSLSRSSDNGYDYYNCDGSDGLGKYNKENFLKLRTDFNKNPENSGDYGYYITLYVLIVFAFNNQIRFNAKGEYNLPVGKRDFNANMQKKLRAFIERLTKIDCEFTCENFQNFDISKLGKNDFVYCDPPYLITCATYNEQNGWNEVFESSLHETLDKLDKNGVKFALSNVLSSKGKTNEILTNWLKSRKYKVIHLNHSYANSNYHAKNKDGFSDEVLILNY